MHRPIRRPVALTNQRVKQSFSVNQYVFFSSTFGLNLSILLNNVLRKNSTIVRSRDYNISFLLYLSNYRFSFPNPDSVFLTCTWRISTIFFFIWTRVLNHNKYVEIKQFSKEDIKQNNISTVILLIKFLVYQWDPRHLQGSRVVYIFIYTLYSCSI